MFNSIIQYDSLTGLTSLSLSTFLIVFVASLVIGFGISAIYMVTHKKEGFANV